MVTAFPRSRPAHQLKESGMKKRAESRQPKVGRPAVGPAKEKKRRRTEIADMQPDFLFGVPRKKSRKGLLSTSSAPAAPTQAPRPVIKISQVPGLSNVHQNGHCLELRPISPKTLQKGATLLCLVTRITSKAVYLSLPQHLHARLPLSEISDPVHARFSHANSILNAGDKETAQQVLGEATQLAMACLTPFTLHPCAVLSSDSDATDSPRLSVTLRYSIIHRGLKLDHLLAGSPVGGAVQSREDHGYIINTGIESVTAFLPYKNIRSHTLDLVIGSPISCILLSSNPSSRTLTLGFNPTLLPHAITHGAHLTLQGLKPGMLVNAAVDLTLKDGLTLSFLNGLSGGVPFEHLDRPYFGTDWRKRYVAGEQVQARILAVNYHSKAVWLTTREAIVGWQVPQGLPEVGDIKEGLVLQPVGKRGLVVGLLEDSQTEARRGQETADEREEDCNQNLDMGEDDGGQKTKEKARRQKILQGPKYVPMYVQGTKVEGTAKVGEIVRVRVVGMAWMEGGVEGSMQREVLEASFLRVCDVAVGELLSCTVEKVESWGLRLGLGQGVRGRVTNMHLTDVARPAGGKVRGRSFKAGQRVSGRALEVDAEKGKLSVTLKQSMVNDKGEILTSLAEARVGTRYTGFVSKVEEYGVIVTFYANVHGLLPAAHLRAHGVDKPEIDYAIGQVVRCVIARVDTEKRRLRLTLEGLGEGDGKGLEVGAITAGIVESMNGEWVRVKTDSGVGRLHKWQLADHVVLADQMHRRLRVQESLGDLMVLEQAKDGTGPLLTRKLLLLEHKRRLAQHTAEGGQDQTRKLLDMEVGTSLVGYISKIEQYGLFIRFLGGQVALCPRALMADRFVEDPGELFREGDSVRCKLSRIDIDKGRAFVTTKCSALPVEETLYMSSYLRESCMGAGGGQEECSGWRRYGIDVTINGRVTALKEYGIVLVADDHKTVLLAPAPEHVAACQVDDVVKARVLDVDFSKGCLIVSLLGDIVQRGRVKERKKAGGRTLQVGWKGNAQIVLKRDRYVVCEVEGSLAYVQVADYHCPYLGTGAHSIGEQLEVVVKEAYDRTAQERNYPQMGVMMCILASQQTEAAPPKAQNSDTSTQELGKTLVSAVKGLPEVPVADIVVGTRLQAVVSDIQPHELLVRINVLEKGKQCRLLARVFVTHSGQQVPAEVGKEAIKGGVLPSWHPFTEYRVGQVVQVRVVEVRKRDVDRVFVIDCSLRPQDLKVATDEELRNLQPRWVGGGLGVGWVVLGVVSEIQAEGCWVSLSRQIKGWLHYLDMTTEQDSGLFIRVAEARAVGLPIVVMVTSMDCIRSRIQLTLKGIRPGLDPSTLPRPPLHNLSYTPSKDGADAGGTLLPQFLPAEGDIVLGRLQLKSDTPALSPASVAVQLGYRLFARLCITEIEDPQNWQDQPIAMLPGSTPGRQQTALSSLRDSQAVRCRVLSNHAGKMDVSTRPSRLRSDLTPEEAIRPDLFPEEGAVIKGYVVNTTLKGCFVRLTRAVTGRVLLKDLSDDFLKNPGQAFPPGKLVAGRVLKVDSERRTVDLSLRPSAVIASTGPRLQFADIKEGMKLKGRVVRVEAYGAFVKLDGSDVTGMCHKSEASEGKLQGGLDRIYEAGDVVKVYVLNVDPESQRINLSMKANRFPEEEVGDGKETRMQDPNAYSAGTSGSQPTADMKQFNEESSADEAQEFTADDQSNVEADSAESSAPDTEVLQNSAEPLAEVLKGEERGSDSMDAGTENEGVGMHWDDFDLGFASAISGAEDGTDEECDEDEEGENTELVTRKARSSRKRAADRRREEEEIRAQEERLMDPTAEPQSADDFERLVLAQPSSSYMWIRYMAHHLSMADVDAARVIGNRALKTIVFREEGEKMNVWVALLNLEHRYGSSETVNDTITRACQSANPKHVHLHAAEMYERAREYPEAEALYKIMTKKYKSSKKVWMHYHTTAIKQNHAEATELLRRSLQCLSKHKHAMVISHYAQAEFEHGSTDRGRTIFEGLVTNYPKRLDLWNVYVDKEIKAGQMEAGRRLLERMCTLRLSPQKMKGVLKKWLRLEVEHGNEASAEAVKQRAREYVESNME